MMEGEFFNGSKIKTTQGCLRFSVTLVSGIASKGVGDKNREYNNYLTASQHTLGTLLCRFKV